MPLTFFCFVLLAGHVSVMVDSKPRLDLHSSLTNTAQAHDTSPPGPSQWRKSSSKRPDFLVFFPVKTHSTNFVPIFDLRKKRSLCMDLMRELFNSKHRDTEDCLFQQLWLNWPNKQDVFYYTRAAQLLKLQRMELNVATEKSSEIHAGLWHRFLKPFVKRQKRSEELNPSDPLRSETHPLSPANNHKETDQSKRNQAGAVSKETITSCDDDPLKVLQNN